MKSPAFDYVAPVARGGVRAARRTRRRRAPARRRADAAGDAEHAPVGAGAADRHQRAFGAEGIAVPTLARQRPGRHAAHRRAGHPHARSRSRRWSRDTRRCWRGRAAHRAPGDPQPRHDRRLDRLCRPGGRVAGLRAGAGRHAGAAGARGERRVAAADFFLGLYTTAMQPDELVAACELAGGRPGERHPLRRTGAPPRRLRDRRPGAWPQVDPRVAPERALRDVRLRRSCAWATGQLRAPRRGGAAAGAEIDEARIALRRSGLRGEIDADRRPDPFQPAGEAPARRDADAPRDRRAAWRLAEGRADGNT